ncbi:MAG: PEP-CTERM sorting domain-containing protein [Phycisphaeraceae bacterium]
MRIDTLTALLATVTLTALPALADVILVNDTFSDGGNPGYTLSPSGGGTVSVATSGTDLTGNALLLSTTSSNRMAIRSLGSSIALANTGDYIELALDYRFAATLNDPFGATVALTGTGGVGAGVNFNPTAGTNQGTYFANPDTNAGRFTAIDSATTAHSLTLRITRVSDTEVRLTSSFDGSPRADSNLEVIGTDISAILTFDGLVVGWVSGNNGDVYYDNILVSTNVPEPASLALLGLATLCLLPRRR